MPRYLVDTSPYVATFNDQNPILGGLGNLNASIINATSASLDRKAAERHDLAKQQMAHEQFMDALTQRRDAATERAQVAREGIQERATASSAATKEHADAASAEEGRRWAEDAGDALLNGLAVIGLGPRAKGTSTPPRDTPRPMNDGELTRAALDAAKADAGVDEATGKQKPVSPARVQFWKKELARRGDEAAASPTPAASGEPSMDYHEPLSAPGRPAASVGGEPPAAAAPPHPPHPLEIPADPTMASMMALIHAGDNPPARDPAMDGALVDPHTSPAAAPAAPRGKVSKASLQKTVDDGHFPNLDAAAAEAQRQGFQVVP